MCNRKYVDGFTLIELMIALALIAILATIAYPLYQDQVNKAKRSDAKAALLQAQMAQEKYRTNNPAYAGDLITLNISNMSPEGYYSITIVSADASSYVITATNLLSADAACNVFAINQDGPDYSYAPVECWSK